MPVQGSNPPMLGAGSATDIPTAECEDTGREDLEMALGEQLKLLQKIICDNQLATFLAGSQAKSMKSMKDDLEKLRTENSRLKKQLDRNGGNNSTDKGWVQSEEPDSPLLPNSIASPRLSLNGSPSLTKATPSEERPSVPSDEHCPVLSLSLPAGAASINKPAELSLSAVVPSGEPSSPRAGRNTLTVITGTNDGKPRIDYNDPSRHIVEEVEGENTEGVATRISCRATVRNDGELGETIEFLRTVPLLKRLPQDDLVVLAGALRTYHYPKGTVLITQGHPGYEFFFLVRGHVSVRIDGQQVNALSSGDYFGECALLSNEPRNASISAESGVDLLKMSREEFQELGLHERLNFRTREERMTIKKPKQVFADAAAMKEKVRAAMAKPPYNVQNFYHETGIAQAIGRSALFDHGTLTVIAINALWIAYDTDNNHADMLLKADLEFMLMENFFCSYFSFEWIVRFCAFKRKRDSLRDRWFVFDSVLVFFMVGETWLMSALILIMGGTNSGGMGNASILRLFRLLRLSRMARMARLLRAMPELMVLIKGMAVAMRSVFFTLCLLAGLIYVFAIAFVQLMKDTENGNTYFPTVPDAMNSLLLDGVVPDQSTIISGVGDEGIVFRLLIMLYILFASLTVMNMLVGVLCEVVGVVSAVEKESLLVNYVKGTLLHMMETSGLDSDGNRHIARSEFEMLLENAQAAKALQEVGVDVIGLVDFTDFIFQGGRELDFGEFMDLVLSLRGTNVATVKDVVDLRKFLISEFEKLGGKMLQVFEEVQRHSKALGLPPAKPIMRYGGSSAELGAFQGTTSMSFGNQRSMNFGNQRSFDPSSSRPAQPRIIEPHASSDSIFSNAVHPFVSEPSKFDPDPAATLNWATAAASRLSAAAGELSAAAGELSTRRKMRLE